jgi:hypothetical protein
VAIRAKEENGGINIMIVVSLIFVCLFLILIFDFAFIFVERERTKNIAETIALAVSQDILFFDNKKPENNKYFDYEKYQAYDIEIILEYDEVKVNVTKNLNTLIAGRILNISSITSGAQVKILYPWGEDFEFCKRYKFEFSN